jgi:hypothetical protein
MRKKRKVKYRKRMDVGEDERLMVREDEDGVRVRVWVHPPTLTHTVNSTQSNYCVDWHYKLTDGKKNEIKIC